MSMSFKEKQRISIQADRLAYLGITWDEAESLRRASMTLQRWGEMECNHDVQRDEKTGKVWVRFCRDNGTMTFPLQVRDRETGALKRCKAIADAHGLVFYHQSDPRGAQVYIGKADDLRGMPIDQAYNRLVCVY